jgi:hypothetical protein
MRVAPFSNCPVVKVLHENPLRPVFVFPLYAALLYIGKAKSFHNMPKIISSNRAHNPPIAAWGVKNGGAGYLAVIVQLPKLAAVSDCFHACPFWFVSCSDKTCRKFFAV